MSLNDDFKNFSSSEAAKKPVFEVREDWREEQYRQALINGDIAADSNPDTSVDSSWSEPDFFEPSEEELAGLEVLNKLSRRSKKLGFNK